MPTVEIISINATHIPDLPKYDGFAYFAEEGVVSHRKLFQHVLNKETGVIVHLANKAADYVEGYWWFASELLDWCGEDSLEMIKFKHLVFADILDLLKRMFEASPIGEIIFLTDFQMGPEQSQIVNKAITLTEFLNLHEDGKLRFNALYRIKRV